MVRIIAIVVCTVLASCQSSYLVDKPVSPQTLAALAKARGGAFMLRDGESVPHIGDLAVFPDAVCISYQCYRISDIAVIRAPASGFDVGTTAQALAAAPFVATAVGIEAMSRPPPAGMTPEQERAWRTANDLARTAPNRWLTGLYKRYETRYSDDANYCRDRLPAGVDQDAQALTWVWDNRYDMRPACLLEAAIGFDGRSNLKDRDRSVRLWALGSVRNAWVSLQCASGSKLPLRVAPEAAYAPGPPSPLSIIAEALADDRTYAVSYDLTAACKEAHIGAAQPAAINREVFVKIVDPFASDALRTSLQAELKR